MTYKMKGWSGYQNSPLKQDKSGGEPVEIFDKKGNYTTEYKNRMKVQRKFKEDETEQINQTRKAFNLKPLSEKRIYKKGDIIHKFDYAHPKPGGVRGPLKQTGKDKVTKKKKEKTEKKKWIEREDKRKPFKEEWHKEYFYNKAKNNPPDIKPKKENIA